MGPAYNSGVLFGVTVTVSLLLLVLAGVLLVLSISTLVFAPLLASRAASATSRPRLERRASGPDRMRTLINAQRSERQKRSTLSTTLTRTGWGLAAGAVICLIAGIVALFANL
jgi:hypothetical protein